MGSRLDCWNRVLTSVEQDFDLPYDYLVVSVGATSNTFGTPGVKEHCIFLKQVQDAQKLRKVGPTQSLVIDWWVIHVLVVIPGW